MTTNAAAGLADPKNWLDSAKFGTPAEDPAKAKGTDTAAETKNMFMMLLIAQIKNQNPLNPADSQEFLGQLSQFTSVEEQQAMRRELTTIRELLSKAAAPPEAAPGN
jgi:flagellar basal-body rod modification protein FlgD